MLLITARGGNLASLTDLSTQDAINVSMPFSTQFSLSLELSRVIPPIVSIASSHLWNLWLEMHNSGSNLVTERALAEVFGRNLIEPGFGRNFRNTVTPSHKHRLSGIVELVLEAGAGPTVRHSLGIDAAPYFSMVVQLSLLTYAHDASSLATSLAMALEQRTPSNAQAQEVAGFTALLGTLKCCRQQTSDYPWEGIFASVELEFEHVLDLQKSHEFRPLSYIILERLLDSLTAVQRFSELHFLEIRTSIGIVTLVVWAHHVLGLTVEVLTDRGTHRVGEGIGQVSIDSRTHEGISISPEVVLFTESYENEFRSFTDPVEYPRLEPACRHPLQGYGSRIVSLELDDQVVAQKLVLHVIKCCLHLVMADSAEQVKEGAVYTGNDFIPSKQRILMAGQLLFPSHATLISQLKVSVQDKFMEEESHNNEGLYTFMTAHQNYELSRKLQRLNRLFCHVVFAFSMINNLEDCCLVPLSFRALLPKQWYHRIRRLTVRDAFETIAILLRGEIPERKVLENAAVISSWGWSLCVDSIHTSDPGLIRPDLAIIRGVPSKKGVWKEWILDDIILGGSLGFSTKGDVSSDMISDCKVVARPGDVVAIDCPMRSSANTYGIGDTDGFAFRVYKKFTCTSSSLSGSAFARIGFRHMQELFWKSSHTSSCEHAPVQGYSLTVPPGTCFFIGFQKPFTFTVKGESLANSTSSLHVGITIGESSARWILLHATQRWVEDQENPFTSVYVRGDHCCVECAIAAIKSKVLGDNDHVVLVI